MPQGRWTINNASGGNDAHDLVGCHIIGTSTGYDFTEPNNDVLASTTSTTPSFTFPSFDYEEYTWDITVLTLPNRASGPWRNNDQTPPPGEASGTAGATLT